MQLLSDFLMSMTNLIEAEGRVLRRNLVQILLAMALIVMCMTFLLTGTALLVLGTFWALIIPYNQITAAFLSGLAAWLLAFVLVIIARSITK